MIYPPGNPSALAGVAVVQALLHALVKSGALSRGDARSVLRAAIAGLSAETSIDIAKATSLLATIMREFEDSPNRSPGPNDPTL